MIRQLRPGEQLPTGQPRRYQTSHGYIRLRWKIGKASYVETYEHRVEGDRVTTAEHVHHVNHDKADNRPENLRRLTRAEHGAEHKELDDEEIARLYRAGGTTTSISRLLGIATSAVSHSLKRSGTPTRVAPRPFIKSIRSKDVALLYLSGLSLVEVAEHFDTSVQVVVRRLDMEGVKRRKAGRTKRAREPRSSAVLSVTPVTAHPDVAEAAGLALPSKPVRQPLRQRDPRTGAMR